MTVISGADADGFYTGDGGDGGERGERGAQEKEGGAGGRESKAAREKSFKSEREARRKDAAGTNAAAWNSLFMRADTVAAAVAAQYGVAKADLLESGADDVAVRMALGEVGTSHIHHHDARHVGHQAHFLDPLVS